jgi:GH25 family lysozyme M1 (1,4-beta-N-acetylmuramidase)
MSQPQGIDVAYPQGSNYNWRQWRGKISFGMCKATEGLTITDPAFVSNWNAMWELNRLMPRFAYHFFHASDDPAHQAERFVATVKPDGLLPGDNLVLDLEATGSSGSNDGVAASVVAEYARTFMNTANGLAPDHRESPQPGCRRTSTGPSPPESSAQRCPPSTGTLSSISGMLP